MLNRATIIIISTFLLCISSIAQDRVTDYRYLADKIDGVYIPKDLDEAIECLDTLLSEEDKQYTSDSLTLESFSTNTHFSIGMWMRNNWGLWGGSRLQRYFTERNVYHPDDMSGIILEAYYKKKIKGMEYSVEDDVAKYALTSATDRGKVIKSGLSRFVYKLRYNWSRGVRERKRELKKEGFKKGETVYYQYPYGCSTKEEEDIWFYLDEDNIESLPKGKIIDIDYGLLQMKVELISTTSPYGVIVFDGNIIADKDGNIEQDFDHFSVNDPNRFYMKKGDVLWFDMKSNYWQPKTAN